MDILLIGASVSNYSSFLLCVSSWLLIYNDHLTFADIAVFSNNAQPCSVLE